MNPDEIARKAIAAYNANVYGGLTVALEAVVAVVLEEAAKVAETLPLSHAGRADLTADQIAAAIRAMKGGE